MDRPKFWWMRWNSQLLSLNKRNKIGPLGWLGCLTASWIVVLIFTLAFAATPVLAQEGVLLDSFASWTSVYSDTTTNVAWGDVDGDGDLDLAVGNSGSPNQLYLNQQGDLQPSAWLPSATDSTTSVAWGDVDGDGDLDLAVGNRGGPNRLYLNERGQLQTAPVWSSGDSDDTWSVAWGDVDGDGDLDLAVGNHGAPNKVYRNQNGILQTAAVWASANSANTRSVAWGDMDGDGDLDLAAGNDGSPNQVYLNDLGNLQTVAAWSSLYAETTRSLVWGDVNNDGRLDLAVGNFGLPNRLYLNMGGMLEITSTWSSAYTHTTTSIAWGDVDGDEYLDLVVGDQSSSIKLYLNDAGTLAETAVWTTTITQTTSIAWGDVDGDGDLDLAAGVFGLPNQLFLNQTSRLPIRAHWDSGDGDRTISLAWGDVDGDGYLDLAAGNGGGGTDSKIYRNNDGVLQTNADHPFQFGDYGDDATSIAWGDVNGDGNLDLAVGIKHRANKLFINMGEQLDAGNPRSLDDCPGGECPETSSIAWGDVDGDGDLDLVAGNPNEANILYQNEGGPLLPRALSCGTPGDNDPTRSIAWGDVDQDGDLDLVAGNEGRPNKIYLNQDGCLQQDTWTPDGSEQTSAVAWGDVNGDGALDLAVGNIRYAVPRDPPNRLYLNQDKSLQPTPDPFWIPDTISSTASLAWGDVDGDGDLDLAAGTGGANKLYINQGGRLDSGNIWLPEHSDDTRSVAWGDMDRDGDLDLAVGNYNSPNRLYLNNNTARPRTVRLWPRYHCNPPRRHRGCQLLRIFPSTFWPNHSHHLYPQRP